MDTTLMSMALTTTWQLLGSVAPTALVEARETLHHAAQLLALAGASFIEPRSDDSHTSMSWRDARSALATQPLLAPEPFRFELGVADLTLAVVDEASGDVGSSFTLDGARKSDALHWMRTELTRGGLDGHRLRTTLHFTIATHPTEDGAPFSTPGDESLAELARWYANASLILEERRAMIPAADPVRCWPHHFDIATLVRPSGPTSLQTIGIGLSPGDESYGEPYYYVGPYPAPAAPPRGLTIGQWHTSSWWGAVLTGSSIVRTSDAHGQRDLVRRFVSGAVDALLTTRSVHE
jgi:hypothetical protein